MDALDGGSVVGRAVLTVAADAGGSTGTDITSDIVGADR
jgi:hypothetical protein